MSVEKRSSILILMACLLWALDLLVRYPITLKINFVHLVFFESSLGLLLISPWLFKDGWKEFKKYSRMDWLMTIFLGGVGMTLAGYLSTSCIQKASPGTFSFFQIFQPLFVVYAAHLFLKEKIDNMYFYWGLWVILSAVLMYSQDLGLMFSNPETVLFMDILIALGTMLIWGLCTIAGKKLLKNHRPLTLVYGRWFFAFIFAGTFLYFEKGSIPVEALLSWDMSWRFVFMSLVAGTLSMYLYFQGMKEMPAARVSFLELSYPAMGLIFSAFYTFESLTFWQMLGATSFVAFIVFTLTRRDLPLVMATEMNS